MDPALPVSIGVAIIFLLFMSSSLPSRRKVLRLIAKGKLADFPEIHTNNDRDFMETLAELHRCKLITGEFVVVKRGYLPVAVYDLRLTAKGHAELRRQVFPEWSKVLVSTVSGIVSGVISGLIVEKVKR
jgi:hypothetical protein